MPPRPMSFSCFISSVLCHLLFVLLKVRVGSKVTAKAENFLKTFHSSHTVYLCYSKRSHVSLQQRELPFMPCSSLYWDDTGTIWKRVNYSVYLTPKLYTCRDNPAQRLRGTVLIAVIAALFVNEAYKRIKQQASPLHVLHERDPAGFVQLRIRCIWAVLTRNRSAPDPENMRGVLIRSWTSIIFWLFKRRRGVVGWQCDTDLTHNVFNKTDLKVNYPEHTCGGVRQSGAKVEEQSKLEANSLHRLQQWNINPYIHSF